MVEHLTFISLAIIERIENGSFVPARQAKTDKQFQDRRDALSPLAVTKRCIRYEPHVYLHRQALVLTLARALNLPERKIALVGGPQGSGKTSLVRALIEVMGSSTEQLLWFDVTRHTDFEEIIQFLIQYITYVCVVAGDTDAASVDAGVGIQEEPIRRLEKLINRVANMPLLLVLDNVEYIVDEELRFNSYPFKEMLNFLLAFPNIKMVLIGERLPYADMSPNQEGVEDIHLEGMEEEQACRWLQSKKKSGSNADPAVLEQVVAPEAEITALHQLYFKTQGQPWLLKILFYLNHQARLDFVTLNRLLDSESKDHKTPPVAELIRYIYQRLPEQHRRIFQVLAFLRHPVNARSLLSIMAVCYPVLGPSGLELATLEDMLEHSMLKVVLKIIYPPQEVLSHIRNRRKQGTGEAAEKKFKPWYELYHTVKRILYASLKQEERERVHAILQNLYLKEKGLEPAIRMLRLKSRALIAEAKYHGSAARERKLNAATLSLGVDLSVDSLASKTYGSRRTAPDMPLTLEDYKSVKLPDGLDLPDEAETSLTGPTFKELLSHSADQLSVEDYLDSLAPNDAEESLLDSEAGADVELSQPSLEDEASEKPAAEANSRKKSPASAKDSSVSLYSFTQAILAEPNTDDQEQSIRQRLAMALQTGDHPAMAKELVGLARCRAGNGNYESACQCLERALSLKAETSKSLLAEIHQLLGSVHKETYHHNAAVGILSKAAVQIRRLMYEDDTVNAVWLSRLGKVYQDLGEIYAYRQQTELALEAFNQSLRWYQSADDETRIAQVYFQLAGLYDDANEPDLAIQNYLQALKRDEAQGNKLSMASALANLGYLYRDSGRLKEAVESFQRSLKLDQEVGNAEGQLNTMDVLAGLYLGHQKWERSESMIRQGLALAIHENAGYWKANFYMRLGQFYELQKNWKQALQHFLLAQDSGTQELSSQSLEWLEQKITEMQTALL